MLSKKYYIQFAEMIYNRKEYLHMLETGKKISHEERVIRDHEINLVVMMGIVDIFADDNSNFDRAKFLKACGLSDNLY